jgi:hypothetical protein
VSTIHYFKRTDITGETKAESSPATAAAAAPVSEEEKKKAADEAAELARELEVACGEHTV